MKNIFRFLILSALCWSCGASTADRSTGAPAPRLPEAAQLSPAERDSLHAAVSQYLDTTLLSTPFNGAILVAKQGQPFYEAYIGYADPRTRDTLTPSSPFQIASTSKPFTAAAVLKLVQTGKLSLQDSFNQYIPGLPYSGVTVLSLLSQRSGLPNYLATMEKAGYDRKQKVTGAEVLQHLIRDKPQKAFAANTAFNYCNTNYVLLSLLIEKASGQRYEDFLRSQIFEPLGMVDTYVQDIEDSAGVRPSFQPNGALWTLDFSDGPVGDKNIHSTVRDLLKWDQAWYGDAVLPKALRDSAFVGYSNEKPGINNYGLGWRLQTFVGGKKVVFHHGRWHGFNSAFVRLTDEKVTIIMLTNKFNRKVYSTARGMYALFGNYERDTVETE